MLARVTLPAVTSGESAASVRVEVRRLDPDVPLPVYAMGGDAGADIVTTVDAVVAPGQRAMLPTGIAIALPDGYAAFVHPRSGLAARTGMSLVNAPGTVDSGYRGEITVNVINHDRVAPIQRVEVGEFVEVDVLPASQRGTGGHGSTGGAAPLRDEGGA